MQNKNCFTGRLDIKAFTLIELLVVVLIIGILAAVALPQYQVAVMKSSYSQLKVTTKSVATGEEIYYLANGVYSADFDTLSIDKGPQIGTSTGRFRCYLTVVDQYGERKVQCNDTKKDIGYLVYLENSKVCPKCQFCVAYNRDLSSPQNKVCRAETKATTPGTGQSGVYTWKYQ